MPYLDIPTDSRPFPLNFRGLKKKTGRTDGWTDGRTDGPSDRHTDGRMDGRVACTHLNVLVTVKKSD